MHTIQKSSRSISLLLPLCLYSTLKKFIRIDSDSMCILFDTILVFLGHFSTQTENSLTMIVTLDLVPVLVVEISGNIFVATRR